MLQFINAKYKAKELENLSFILNFYKHKTSKGYGYGGGYGYGYGVYGNNYHENQKKKSFIQKIKQKFKQKA